MIDIKRLPNYVIMCQLRVIERPPSKLACSGYEYYFLSILTSYESIEKSIEAYKSLLTQ